MGRQKMVELLCTFIFVGGFIGILKFYYCGEIAKWPYADRAKKDSVGRLLNTLHK